MSYLYTGENGWFLTRQVTEYMALTEDSGYTLYGDIVFPKVFQYLYHILFTAEIVIHTQ